MGSISSQCDKHLFLFKIKTTTIFIIRRGALTNQNWLTTEIGATYHYGTKLRSAFRGDAENEKKSHFLVSSKNYMIKILQ